MDIGVWETALIAVDRTDFCTTANERVYITAIGCEIEFDGTRGLYPKRYISTPAQANVTRQAVG
jgi:hypothetical protein